MVKSAFKRSIRSSIVTLSLCLMLSGCSEKQPNLQGSRGSAPPLSEHSLSNAIRLGSVRADIIARFGQPKSREQVDGRVIDNYSMDPKELQSWNNQLTGFQVLYENDKVVQWAPVYSSLSAPTVVKTPDHSRGIVLYIADGPKSIAELEAEKSSLTLRTIRSVSLDSDTSGKKGVTFELCEADRMRLADLTRDAAGKDVVITIGGEPIGKFVILHPLETRSVRITSLPEGRLPVLESWLKGLVGNCPQ